MEERRKVALWSLGTGVLLALLMAAPAFEEYTSRTDFAAGTLDPEQAVVEKIELTSGTSLEGRWYDQEITFRIPGEGTIVKPGDGEYVPGIKEGESATLGLSHGTLVSVNGVYVRPHPFILNFVTPPIAGAFVLAAIYGFLLRGRPWDPGPYTAGYVTQGMVLCMVFGLFVDPPWWPAAAVVVGTAVPLLIYAVRFTLPKAIWTPGARRRW